MKGLILVFILLYRLYKLVYKDKIYKPQLTKETMKTKGAFGYREEHEDLVLKFVTKNPQTTPVITSKIKEGLFDKIHKSTVKRLLEKLKERGLIKKVKVGRVTLWQI